MARNKKDLKLHISPRALSALFFWLSFAFIDFFFHGFIYGFGKAGLGFACLCGAVLGSLAALISYFVKGKIRLYISGFLLFIYGLFACVQLVYFRVFGSILPLNLVGMGGDAITTFFSLVVTTIWENLWGIALLLLPAIALCFCKKICGFVGKDAEGKGSKRKDKQKYGKFPGKKYKGAPKKKQKKNGGAKPGKEPCVLLGSPARWEKLAVLSFAVLLIAACALGAFIHVDGAMSPLEIYQSSSTTIEMWYQRFGLGGGTLRELLGPGKTESEYASAIYISENAADSDLNVFDIDFDALAETTDDETLKSLDAYFKTASATAKNEYTGLFSGCNLITICAESFCPYLIDSELTPALYKLSHQGIIFNNYYGSMQSITSNGEYSLSTGLLPVSDSLEVSTTFESSIGNYLPFCLGNKLSKYGYRCYAYHSNVGTFYSRNKTHTNMGYEFKAADSGLDIVPINPSSDLELFEKSVSDFISADTPFHAYYMTWSGHSPYNQSNAMSAKNWDITEDLDYNSESVKAYIACNMELEYAMEYLLDFLEENGLADNTVIVLTNDHYPYKLSEEEYNELAGEEIDTDFEKYRNSFICYAPWLEENIEVDSYCSTIDILPTLLNLFGAKYDSRLLAGRDILAEGIHIAVLGNHSFITEEIRYNAESGYAADDTVKDSNGYTQADYKKYVDNLFAISEDILSSDYYAHLFSEESRADEDSGVYFFSDLTVARHKSAAQFMVGGGYMQPESDDTFGAFTAATAGELADILARFDGSYDSSRDSLEWLRSIGALGEFDYLTRESELENAELFVILRNYAEYIGEDTSVTEEEMAEAAHPDYPETDSVLSAYIWAKRTAVSNKTPQALAGLQGTKVNRIQMACYASYFRINIMR